MVKMIKYGTSESLLWITNRVQKQYMNSEKDGSISTPGSVQVYASLQLNSVYLWFAWKKKHAYQFEYDLKVLTQCAL